MQNTLKSKYPETDMDVSSYVNLNIKHVTLISGVSCLDPGQIANGVRIGSAPFFCGSVVTYTCSAGFRLEGSATRVCGGSGQWSTAAPVCRQGKINVTWMDGLGYVFDQLQWKKLFIKVEIKFGKLFIQSIDGYFDSIFNSFTINFNVSFWIL